MTTFTDERRLTWDEAKAELLRISTSRGEHYVYPDVNSATCHYRWDTVDAADGRCTKDQIGQPACLLGQAMSDWGLLNDLITPYEDGPDEHEGRFYQNYDAIQEVLTPEVVPTTSTDWPWVKALFEEAQSNQDSGMEWPVAVRSAITAVDYAISQHHPDTDPPEGWTPHQWSE